MRRFLIIFFLITSTCVMADEKQPVASNMNRQIGDSQSYAHCTIFPKTMGYSPENPTSYEKTVGGYGSLSQHIRTDHMPNADYYAIENKNVIKSSNNSNSTTNNTRNIQQANYHYTPPSNNYYPQTNNHYSNTVENTNSNLIEEYYKPYFNLGNIVNQIGTLFR